MPSKFKLNYLRASAPVGVSGQSRGTSVGPVSGAAHGGLPTIVLPAQQLRQLGGVGGDAPGLVAGEEVRRRPPSRRCDKMRLGLPAQAAFY
jgi:hypothetical protein